MKPRIYKTTIGMGDRQMDVNYVDMGAGNQRGSPIDLSEVLRGFLGGFFETKPRFNLGSAHFNFYFPEHLPRKVFRESNDRALKCQKDPDRIFIDYPHISEVIQEIYKEETTLPLDNLKLQIHDGSTRYALQDLFFYLSTQDKTIGVPLPNWHFWDLSDEKHGKKINFTFLDGKNEDALVEDFKSKAKRKELGALILVNPMNPLLREYTVGAMQEIGQIAQRNGIDVVVDDVLRGTNPQGRRDTIARFIENPYIVEGLSKRFGDDLLGDVSWILSPGNSQFCDYNQMTRTSAHIMGELLNVSYKFTSDKAVEELEKRNKAFEKGLVTRKMRDVKLIRPYESSLTTLVEFPEGFPKGGKEFADSLLERKGIEVAPMHLFHPENYQVPTELDRYVRVTVGRLPPKELRIAGKKIREAVLEEF